MGDVFDGHPCAREQRHEAVPELAWCPSFRVEAGCCDSAAERSPHIRRVEGRAGVRVEYQGVAGHGTSVGLVLPPQLLESINAPVGKLKRAPGLRGLRL